MNPLTPDEESTLRWYATGAYYADLDVRSSLGPQLERLRTGQTRCQSSPEMRDIGPAAERLARVRERVRLVREADSDGADALLWFYGGFEENAHRERYDDDPLAGELVGPNDPLKGKLVAPGDVPDHGHYTKPLPTFGEIGVVMWKLSGLSVRAINDFAEKARKSKAKGHEAALGRMTALRARAEEALAKGQAAYAATRPARVDDEASRERAGKARQKREGERREAFAGRTDEAGRVVYATAGARRAAGGGR